MFKKNKSIKYFYFSKPHSPHFEKFGMLELQGVA